MSSLKPKGTIKYKSNIKYKSEVIAWLKALYCSSIILQLANEKGNISSLPSQNHNAGNTGVCP